MPVFAGMFLIITMGSAGLPALSGFIGEFLTIFGTFNAGCDYVPAVGVMPPDGGVPCMIGQTLPPNAMHFIPAPHWLGALAATGVIFGAIYLLFMFHKVFFGKLDKARNGNLPDLKGHELAAFIPLVLAIFIGGLFPRPLLQIMEPSVQKFIKDFDRRLGDAEWPDHSAHLYGQQAPAVSAEIQKNLDDAAAAAQGVANAMKGGTP
jgi:NADH-quinone oxidoreductase subunit M